MREKSFAMMPLVIAHRGRPSESIRHLMTCHAIGVHVVSPHASVAVANTVKLRSS